MARHLASPRALGAGGIESPPRLAHWVSHRLDASELPQAPGYPQNQTNRIVTAFFPS